MGVYTDNFNRANGSLGANWTDLLNGLVITSNLCDGASGALNVGYWSANSVAAYQYSQIVSAGTFIGQLFGPAVRCAESDNCYWLAINSSANTATIRILTSGSGSAIGSAISIATVAAGQTFRLEVDGTTLRSYRNGTLLDTITDATHSSGQPGIVIQANGEFDRADNWEGGDLNSGDIGSSAGVATAGFVGLGLNSEGVPASDLVAWFRSDSEVTESGGRVSAWGDKTANGNDLAQATAGNQPLLVADGGFMAGTIPFIRLVGSRNDYMAQTGAGNDGSPWTYAAVCRKTELGTFEWVWGANESYRCIGIHSTNKPVLFAGNVVGHTNYTVPGTWGLLVGVFNGASSQVYWNDVASGTVDMGSGVTSGEGLMLGSDPGSGGSGCDYDVAELFRWDRALGSAELAALTDYILEIYGPLFTARFRADTEVTDAGGGAVSAWGDMGLGGFDLAQAASGERPTLVSSVINGEPVIRFTRAGASHLERASTPVMTIQPFSFATYVTGLVAHTGGQWLITTDDQYRGLLFQSDETFSGFAGETAAFDATPIDGNPHSLIGNIIGGSNTANGWVDGVLGSASPVTVNSGGGAGGNGIRIGEPSGGFGEVSIDVAEALLFDHALSTDEVTYLQAYFVDRYETIHGSVFASDGVATGAFTGSSTFDGALASNGVATASFTGQGAADGVVASAGVATGAFEGTGDTETMLLSEGVAGVTWVGISNVAPLTADGVATAAFVGQYAVDAVWGSNGVAFCLFTDAIFGVLTDEDSLATVEWVGDALGGDNWIAESPPSGTWTPEAGI